VYLFLHILLVFVCVQLRATEACSVSCDRCWHCCLRCIQSHPSSWC